VFWGFFVIFGIGGFFLVRRHPLFLIPILLLVFLFYWSQAIEIHSDLEPEIIKQEGYIYIVYFRWLVLIGPLLLSVAGIPAYIKRWDKKKLRHK
jgi:TRAP-type mannitol/chloroaromatic compound transport system permease small subunit